MSEVFFEPLGHTLCHVPLSERVSTSMSISGMSVTPDCTNLKRALRTCISHTRIPIHQLKPRYSIKSFSQFRSPEPFTQVRVGIALQRGLPTPTWPFLVHTLSRLGQKHTFTTLYPRMAEHGRIPVLDGEVRGGGEETEVEDYGSGGEAGGGMFVTRYGL